MASFQFVSYPNPLTDIVVVGFVDRITRSFTVKPKQAGTFRLLVWPQTIPEVKHVVTSLMEFPNTTGPPSWFTFTPPENLLEDCKAWSWCLVETSQQSSIEEIISSNGASSLKLASGVLYFTVGNSQQARTIVWSCHQPYTTRKNPKSVGVEQSWTLNAPKYSALCDEFLPDIVWGLGDTAYADGADAANFPKQFEHCPGWYNIQSNKELLKEMYRQMYRYHWSFSDLQSVMRKFPHILMWDDHEIRDGWGSHRTDIKPECQHLFQCAHAVAEEFVLNTGPRVLIPLDQREKYEEAFYSYILGPQANFIFDTRTARRYSRKNGQLISSSQWIAFQTFLKNIATNSSVKYLLLGATVPFFHLRSLVMNTVDYWKAWMPKLGELQDDIRDSWSSPGNQSTLQYLLEELAKLHEARPDLVIAILSGDIHVANAFAFQPPGFAQPIFQVTTSALSNRHHMGKTLNKLISRGKRSNSKIAGKITRLWHETYDSNVLCITATQDKISFQLQVFGDSASPASATKSLTIWPGSKWEVFDE